MLKHAAAVLTVLACALITVNADGPPSLYIPKAVDYLGCFPDVKGDADVNATHPKLRYKVMDVTDLTLEKCIQACKDRSFYGVGVRDGTGCFCDNPDGPAEGADDNAKCNKPCSGNENQMCGAPTHMSVVLIPVVYKGVQGIQPSQYNYMGCFNSTDLKMGQIGAPQDDQLKSSMSVDACRQRCVKNHYNVFALQGGDTCFCGSMGPKSVIPGRHRDADCGMPCSGAKNELCGGKDVTDMYFAAPIDESIPNNGIYQPKPPPPAPPAA